MKEKTKRRLVDVLDSELEERAKEERADVLAKLTDILVVLSFNPPKSIADIQQYVLRRIDEENIYNDESIMKCVDHYAKLWSDV
jgi:hypothetical protein